MIKRELYLKKIRGFYKDTLLIKIIYGLRRSGKSVILTQIIEELKEQGINDEQIIYINFESLDYSNITDAKSLDTYIKKLTKTKKVYYIFLDEVQKVIDFEKAINSLRIEGRYSIFITGSNSKMTFAELSTELTGRYVSFKVNPLTFKEIIELTKTPKEDYENLILDIFEWGSLPQRFYYNDNAMKTNYISNVYDSIVLKDVVERLGIKDITTFNKIFQYLLEIEGKEFSSTNIMKFLANENIKISNSTLYSYLDALCSTFLLNKVYRYDVDGKNVLKTLNKYYVSDLGVKKIKSNLKIENYSTSLENLIYNDLIAKGYEVYIGKIKRDEVDFVVIKNKELKYIQVSYKLANNEKTIEREFGAYNVINDNHEKYVISLDKEDYTRNGIKHLNAIDFLMNDEF
ncbi:MAG: ATP-binding protein [Bacilli bacterium]